MCLCLDKEDVNRPNGARRRDPGREALADARCFPRDAVKAGVLAWGVGRVGEDVFAQRARVCGRADYEQDHHQKRGKIEQC